MKIKPKIGLISCSGEGLSEGMISREATRRILEQRDDVVTICLPLFLAGGQEERDFAKNNPCVTIDGCDKICAAKGVKMYGKVNPKSSIVISKIAEKQKSPRPTSKSKIKPEDEKLVQETIKIINKEIYRVKEEE
ncbi:MAG TPA: putative zinc-binding protein [Patescibacteria group bacterium]|nr:putative zinc-binding protein [Patescibacteria group bacterium]